jgi:hypothetical protein
MATSARWTPDERRDRDAAIKLARVSLDGQAIAALEVAASQVDITAAAIAVLDAIA